MMHYIADSEEKLQALLDRVILESENIGYCPKSKKDCIYGSQQTKMQRE